MGNTDSLDSPRPGFGEATTFPHIIFSTLLHRTYIRMSLFPGIPKVESRNCPNLHLELWASITSCSNIWLRWSLKQSCSSLWDLFNAMLHSTCWRRNWVDSWLLMVESQIGSLISGPSFAHTLGCICLNDSFEAILNIYTSRPLQRYKEHPMQGVLTPVINPWIFRSPKGPQVFTFGSVSFTYAPLSPRVNPLEGFTFVKLWKVGT
jgi:hypothetical protein